MSQKCDLWESWEQPDDRHLETCPTCNEQWLAHRALADLSLLPRGELDAGFARRTRLRAATEVTPYLLPPVARTVMRFYWLLAALAAVVILVGTSVPPDGWPAVMLGLGAVALGTLPALLLLRQQMNWSFLDFVVWTVK